VVVEREAVVVSVAGEIDAHTAPLWWTAMEQALSSDKRLVVDLTETTFMDSAGLMVLRAARQRLGDDPTALVVRGPNGLVAKSLSRTGLDRILSIESRPRWGGNGPLRPAGSSPTVVGR